MTTRTKEQIDEAKALQGAAAVFDALSRARIAEQHVRLFHRRYKSHPAYKQFMSDLGLERWLAEFVDRKEIRSG